VGFTHVSEAGFPVQGNLIEFFNGLSESVFLIRDLVFVGYLVVIFVYDLRYMLILDRVTIPAMIIAITLNLWLGIIPTWSIFVGGLVIAAFFWIQFFVSRGTWVGGGDIRMGALMGFMLGLWHGLAALFFAYVLGAIVSVLLVLVGKASRKTPIPFGVFLCVGTLVMLFAGQSILDWYFGFFV
jgi:prepilin signal peptidase PulO-like enzyme (type II secretory pathway)